MSSGRSGCTSSLVRTPADLDVWAVAVDMCAECAHPFSVMAMSVSRDGSFALTVSADHLIGRYNLTVSPESGVQLPANAAVNVNVS